MRFLVWTAVCAATATFATLSFAAKYKVCNDTSETIRYAYAFRDGATPVSRGYWAVDAGKCSATIAVPAREFYVTAHNDNRAYIWGDSTEGSDFCTNFTEGFDLRGAQPCDGWNFERRGFLRVPQQASVTQVRLAYGNAHNFRKSLRVCNRTGEQVFFAFGYSVRQDWKLFSEGWWNLENGACDDFTFTNLLDHWFVYGKNDSGSRTFGGAHQLCTSGDAFTYAHGWLPEHEGEALSCEDGYAARGFVQVPANRNGVYTFR